MPAATAKAMNKIPGVKARFITHIKHVYQEGNEYGIYLNYPERLLRIKPVLLRKLVSLIFHKVIFECYRAIVMTKWLLWADVVHWTGDSAYKSNYDLWLLRCFRKKRFIEWVGSEMRVPEVTMKESPWYEEAFHNGYEYPTESKEASYALQEKFFRYGFTPVLVPEMQLFLKPGLFSKVYTTQYRVFERDRYPQAFFPEERKDKIVIVHAPSAKFAKGSNYIIPIVEELKQDYPIEFIMLHGVPRQEVIRTMQGCDIFIDQIVLGSYASAAIEAMSFGKPTVAYIMDSVYKQGIPYTCPIVNAHPDNLKEKLIGLLDDARLRSRIGRESRSYVEQFHDADKIALQLLDFYKESKE